jgi:hypothetical protein
MTRKSRRQLGWTRVRFGDVAFNSTAVSRDPQKEGFTRYIIGKHIEDTRRRVESWGDVGDSDFGPRIRTIFLPGDVICTTRGPKLKVATVDFRGLGAHTNFVLRTADPEVLLQPYLEAVVRSDSFQQHLAKHFRGSVNLFVNWSDAALYEFLLPPIEHQQSLVPLLQAAEAAELCYGDAAQALLRCRRAAINGAFAPNGDHPDRVEIQDARLAKGYELTSAELLSSASVTKGDTPRGEFRSDDGEIPFIKINNLTFVGELDFAANPSFISVAAHERKLARSKVVPGDVLMNLVGPPLGKIAMVTDEFPEWNINQAIARYRPRTSTEGAYLWYYLMSDWAQGWLHRRSKKTSGQRNLTLELARALPVPIPSDRSRLAEIVDRLDRVARLSKCLTLRRTQLTTVSRAVQKHALGLDA